MTTLPKIDPRPLVLAHGCFDLLHLGHIRHLQEARKLGSRLAVSVTSDRFVNKGAGRPRFTAEQRAEALRALSFVDEVHINDWPDATPIIEKLRPDIYVKGQDYAGRLPHGSLGKEIAALETCGGKFIVTRAEKWSSSRLLNAEQHNEDVNAYLEQARERKFLSRIDAAFKKAAELRVLFVGESIVDQYVYVAPLSKPSKEFVLAAAEISAENFRGGVNAAASHLASFCKVNVVTQSPMMPIIKRRYVEQGFTRKLFEVYTPARLDLQSADRAKFLSELEPEIKSADVAIVLDFGHGLIDHMTRAYLNQAKFLAVNAQTNAGNQGFNLVTKYQGADYVCVDGPEARLAVQDQTGPMHMVIDALERKTGASNLIVTHGREGAYMKHGRVPAIATQPVDTMGAGDCFLAFTAPLIASGLSIEEAAFVGNVAAGMKTGIVGHRESVNGQMLLQTVRALLQ